MNDYLTVGPAPADEDCVQLGEENYEARAQAECERFVKLIRSKLGKEPEGANLRVKAFRHDFGLYYEVVVYYDPEAEAAVAYAFRVEADAPTEWEKE